MSFYGVLFMLILFAIAGLLITELHDACSPKSNYANKDEPFCDPLE
jgi:hypothetical protein